MKRCTFNICRIDDACDKAITEEHTGYEVDIRGLRCFVDRRRPGHWTVTEALTGCAFAGGDTRREAVAEARNRLAAHCDGFIVGAVARTAHSIGVKGLPWPVNEDA